MSHRAISRAQGLAGTSSGFTLIELLIVVAVIGAVAAVAVPGLLRARMSTDEASAIGSLKAINNAQASYSISAGFGGYAAALATLASSCPAGSPPFISADLSRDPSIKSGYRIALQAASGGTLGQPDCNGTPTHLAFYSTAVPVAFGASGRTGFASNSGGSIYFDFSGVAPTEAAMTPGGGGQVLR